MKINNKYVTFFLLLLFGVFAIASGIPQKFATDIVQFGNGNNGEPKEFIFNQGGGALNPRITSETGTGNFVLNRDTTVSGNNLTLGDGAASDKILNFDIGAGANNPSFKYDNTLGVLQFTNDGSSFQAIGSGSGGVGQEQNLLANLNPDFEDGLAEWTVTGGTFTLETTNPLFGSNSGIFTPTSSIDTFQSALLTAPVGFYGRACSFEMTYRYPANSIGPENPDWQVRIFKKQAGNATEDVIVDGELDQTGTLTGKFSAIFDCPSEDDTPLRVTIRNQEPSATAITFDSFFIGYGRQTVDVGGSAVTLETSGWHVEAAIFGSDPSLETDFNLSDLVIADSGLQIQKLGSSADVSLSCAGGPSQISGNTCGASQEKVGITVDIPTAGRYKVCAAFNVRMLMGSCTSCLLGYHFYINEKDNTFGNSIQQEGGERNGPIVQRGSASSTIGIMESANDVCGTFDLTTAGQKVFDLQYRSDIVAGTGSRTAVVRTQGTALGSPNIYFTMEKLDEQFPTPVFTDLQNSLKQRVNSSVTNAVIETAAINQTGTQSFDEFTGDWINSLTDTGAGKTTINIKPGTFLEGPNCVVTTKTSAGGFISRCRIVSPSTTSSVQVECEGGNSSTDADGTFNIICLGRN